MTKRKIARSAGSILLSLALAMSGVVPGTSSVKTAYAAETTVTIIPASDADETKQGTGKMEISLSITKAINDNWVILGAEELSYTGSAQKPAVTVKYTAGETEQTLTENTDYTITIKDSNETVVAEPIDVGTYTITVNAATGSFYTGSASKTYKIIKSTPAAPAAPTLDSKTKTSVKLVSAEECEYSKDGANWQAEPEFTGLLSGTEYSFYQRKVATDNTNASDASEALKVTTDEDTYSMEITLVITPEDAVKNMISNLPEKDKVATTDKDAIEAARKAYDELTEEQQRNISEDILKKLTDAESALEAAELNKAIADLPNADKVTVNDKDAIEAARTAYEALTDDQKKAVGADTLAKLEAVEVALVNKTIEALPEAASVTKDDKDAIEAARAAYDALTDAQKEKVSADMLAKLEVCEVALAIAELPAANKVTVSDNKAIKAARDAYDALTKEQKAKISADTLKKLTDAEDKILIIETVSELVSDQAKADEVTDRINNALPAADEITLKDEIKVAAARMAYELLTDAQKDLVSEETLNKLEAAEKKISDLKEQAALDAAKESAIERLDVYAEARAKSDATADEKAAFDKAVADGKKAINEAKTQEAVAEALTNAKALVNEAIAKIEKDRADAAAAAAEMAAADKAVEDANTGAEAAKNAAEEAAANEYASDADKNAIKNAKETLDAKIKEAEDLPAGATAQQKIDAAKAIEDAVKALNEAVDTANIHSAAAKAEAEAAATAAEQLAAAKTTAIDRLDIYAEARAKADATADEKAAFDKAVADGKKAINDVESQETVAEALTNAKTLVDEAIAKIEKDRADAAAAAAEMAAADKALEDANAAAQTAKTDAEAATANKYASDEDKNAIRTAKETLEAKIKAAADLPETATAKNKEDAAKAIEDAVKALNEAVDTANIHSAAAKAEADAAATAAEQLAAAKTAAIERLDDYSEAKAKSDATAGEKAAYDKAVADGKTAVNAATDIDAVTTALKGAKAAVDAAIAKIEKDRVAADKVADAISKLTPSDKVRTTDKAAIEAAGDAYDALTADQKDLIPSDVLKKLTDAQKALMEADNKPADLPSDAEAKGQAKISNQKRDEMVDLLNSKGTHEVKGIYQTGYDTVKANYVIINGKITQMSIDTSSLKEGKNYLTINTGVRLVLGDYFTVSGNTVDAKDAKKIAKFVKIKKEGCVFEPKRLKSHKGGSYQVILTNGKIELIVDVIDVSLNKKAIKKITLTGAVNKDAVSANAVAADKIGAEGSSVSGNVVTIATSPAFKSEIPSMKDKSARFISGIWQVGDTYVSMGEVKTVTKGKVSVIVKANNDGTLSIGKAEGSSRGSIKINYVLNGKVKKTRRGTRIKSMVYKAKVKVK